MSPTPDFSLAAGRPFRPNDWRKLTRPKRENPFGFALGARACAAFVALAPSKAASAAGGERPGLPYLRRSGPFSFSEKPTMQNNNTIRHIETLGQIAERVRLDVAMIAHRLENLLRNLDNAPSPCNGRAVAKVVGDFVADLREAIAPLR